MQRWQVIITIVLITVIGIGIWIFMKKEPAYQKPTSGTTIVAFGDSLVEGVGATPGNDFVPILSKKLGVPIINAGRSGDTTDSALARIESDVIAKNPKIVIVLLGGNDILNQTPKETMFKNLTAIIDAIQTRGAAVILIGIRGGLFYDAYHKDFKELAKQKGAFYVADALKGVLGNPELMSDTIHPNDTGYAMLASRIEPVLRKILTR